MKLKAVHQIIRKAGDVAPGKVFECKEDEAKELMALGAAVEASEEEVLIDGALSKPAKKPRKTTAKKPAAKAPETKAGDDDMLGAE